MITVMGDNFIGKVFGEIQSSIGDFFSGWIEWFTSPLWLWYGIGLAVFCAVCVIAFFLPFKWVRAALGGILVLGGAFLFGGITMYKGMRQELKNEREKRKALERRLRTQHQNHPGWFKWSLLLFLLIPGESRAQYEFSCNGLHQAIRHHGSSAVRRWAVSQGYTANQIKSAAARCSHRRNGRVVRSVTRVNSR